MLMLNLIPLQALKVRAGALRLSASGLRTVEGNPGQKAETLFLPNLKPLPGSREVARRCPVACDFFRSGSGCLLGPPKAHSNSFGSRP